MTAASGMYLSGQSVSYAIDDFVTRPDSSGSLAGQPPEVNELAALIGPFWSADRVRSALGGIDRKTLDRMGREGEVLGVTTSDGVTIYPVRQFQPLASGAQVKPAIQKFTRALRHLDPWTVAVLLHTPSPELQGATPLEWDREGEHAGALLDLAFILAREIR